MIGIDMQNKVQLTELISELKKLNENLWRSFIVTTLKELRDKCDKALHEIRNDAFADDLMKTSILMIDNFTNIPINWVEVLKNQIMTMVSNADVEELEKKYWQK